MEVLVAQPDCLLGVARDLLAVVGLRLLDGFGRPVGDAMAETVTPADPLVVMSTLATSGPPKGFTPDGCYPTGELGHLDANGFLFYRRTVVADDRGCRRRVRHQRARRGHC